MSLVLSRKIGERVNLLKQDNGVFTALATFVVTKVKGNRVTLAIDARPEVRILRSELDEKPQGELEAVK